MTEQEWQTSTKLAVMLDYISRGCDPTGLTAPIRPVSDRKLRLFACACCRQVWHLLTDERSRRAVEVAERFADSVVTEQECFEARTAAFAAVGGFGSVEFLAIHTHDPQILTTISAYKRHVPSTVQADLLREILGNPWRPVTLPKVDGKRLRAAKNKLSKLKERFDGPLPMGLGAMATMEMQARELMQAKEKVKDLSTDQSCPWLTPTVVSLATVAYSERLGRVCETCKNGYPGWGLDARGRATQADRNCPSCHGTGRVEDGRLDNDRLKVLADALSDRGCEDDTILTHLRSDGVHVRGCWVIDLLLGKQ